MPWSNGWKKILKMLLNFAEWFVPVVKTITRSYQILEACHHGYREGLAAKDEHGADGWLLTNFVDAGNHWGCDKMLQLALERWKFPPLLKIKDTVQDIINRCEQCQQMRGLTLAKTGATMHPIKHPDWPFKQWGIHCIRKIKPAMDGYCYIINAIDFMSKYIISGLLWDKSKLSIAQFLYKNILCVYGPPEVFITDQGSEFNNDLVDGITHLTNLDHHCTHAYHPQANRLCEKMNGMMQNQIKKQIGGDKKAWVIAHPAVVLINSTCQASTKLSPYEIMFRFKPLLPVQKKINFDDEVGSSPEEEALAMTVEESCAWLSEIWACIYNQVCINNLKAKEVQIHIYNQLCINNLKAKEVQICTYNCRHSGNTQPAYQVGDRV